MNKKQLIVLWVMAGIIATTILFSPRYNQFPREGGYVRLPSTTLFKANDMINWNLVLGISVVVIMFGVLIIYTLRDKKK